MMSQFVLLLFIKNHKKKTYISMKLQPIFGWVFFLAFITIFVFFVKFKKKLRKILLLKTLKIDIDNQCKQFFPEIFWRLNFFVINKLFLTPLVGTTNLHLKSPPKFSHITLLTQGSFWLKQNCAFAIFNSFFL